jgi:hypothetical protein
LSRSDWVLALAVGRRQRSEAARWRYAVGSEVSRLLL